MVRRYILLSINFLILLVGVSLPGLYPLAKAFRVDQHLSAARAAEESESWQRSLSRLLAARNLDPENPQVLASLGPAAAKVYHPSTLSFYIEAAEKELLGPDALIEMIEYGLRTGEPDRVRSWLDHLMAAYPDNRKVQALKVQYLQRDRKIEESLDLAGTLIDEEDLRLRVITAYVRTLLNRGRLEASDQAEAIASLKKMALERGEPGLYALRVLNQFWPQLSEEEKAFTAEQTEAFGELPDQLNILSRLRAEGADPADILERGRRAYAAFRAEEEDDSGIPAFSKSGHRRLFIIWLNRERFFEEVFVHLPDPDEIKDPAEYFVRLLALIETGRTGEARAYALKRNPLSSARSMVTVAITYEREGRQLRVRPNLESAIQQVAPSDVDWMEQVLLSANAPDLAMQLFEKVESWPDEPLKAHLKLIRYYYGYGRETDIQRVVKSMEIEALKGFRPAQVMALYYAVLYHPDRSRVRRHLESLLDTYPNLVEPRLFLAFSYAQSGRTAEARAFLGDWEKFGLEKQRHFAIMLAYIHVRMGKFDTARALLSARGIDAQSLFDQERVLLNSLI